MYYTVLLQSRLDAEKRIWMWRWPRKKTLSSSKTNTLGNIFCHENSDRVRWPTVLCTADIFVSIKKSFFELFFFSKFKRPFSHRSVKAKLSGDQSIKKSFARQVKILIYWCIEQRASWVTQTDKKSFFFSTLKEKKAKFYNCKKSSQFTHTELPFRYKVSFYGRFTFSHIRFRSCSWHSPTDPFTTREIQDPSHDVSELNKIALFSRLKNCEWVRREYNFLFVGFFGVSLFQFHFSQTAHFMFFSSIQLF